MLGYNKIKKSAGTCKLCFSMLNNKTTGIGVRKRKVDGCTASPDFIFLSACNEHDRDYIEAHEAVESDPPKLPKKTQKETDLNFGHNMREAAKASSWPFFWKRMAGLYYIVVRMVGAMYWPTKAVYDLNHYPGASKEHFSKIMKKWYG